jgi:hypothetical protein
MRLSILFLLLGCSIATAQDFKKIRVGISGGWGLKEGANLYTMTLEPSYRISEKISVGIRFEGANGGSPFLGASHSYLGSYGLNGQYYFSNKDLRPFAGMGLGFYHPRVSGSGDPFGGASSSNEETKLGVYPRVGFDYGHLTLCLEYNLVPTSNATFMDFDGTTTTNEIKNSYTSLKLGFNIGGGRKKK